MFAAVGCYSVHLLPPTFVSSINSTGHWFLHIAPLTKLSGKCSITSFTYHEVVTWFWCWGAVSTSASPHTSWPGTGWCYGTRWMCRDLQQGSDMEEEIKLPEKNTLRYLSAPFIRNPWCSEVFLPPTITKITEGVQGGCSVEVRTLGVHFHVSYYLLLSEKNKWL